MAADNGKTKTKQRRSVKWILERNKPQPVLIGPSGTTQLNASRQNKQARAARKSTEGAPCVCVCRCVGVCVCFASFACLHSSIELSHWFMTQLVVAIKLNCYLLLILSIQLGPRNLIHLIHLIHLIRSIRLIRVALVPLRQCQPVPALKHRNRLS